MLTATQEGNYNTTEGMGSVPFDGVILAHSNESEWQTFRNNKHNEAFLDRVYIVKVPYCVRVTEEIEIYKKLLSNSSLEGAPCAPDTLDMLAQFSVLSRIKEPENSSIFSKMRVYDGQNIKDTDPKAKSIQEYRDAAGVMEGMDGTPPASPSRSCPRCSTSTPLKWPQTRCICCMYWRSRSSRNSSRRKPMRNT